MTPQFQVCSIAAALTAIVLCGTASHWMQQAELPLPGELHQPALLCLAGTVLRAGLVLDLFIKQNPSHVEFASLGSVGHPQ